MSQQQRALHDLHSPLHCLIPIHVVCCVRFSARSHKWIIMISMWTVKGNMLTCPVRMLKQYTDYSIGYKHHIRQLYNSLDQTDTDHNVERCQAWDSLQVKIRQVSLGQMASDKQRQAKKPQKKQYLTKGYQTKWLEIKRHLDRRPNSLRQHPVNVPAPTSQVKMHLHWHKNISYSNVCLSKENCEV